MSFNLKYLDIVTFFITFAMSKIEKRNKKEPYDKIIICEIG